MNEKINELEEKINKLEFEYEKKFQELELTYNNKIQTLESEFAQKLTKLEKENRKIKRKITVKETVKTVKNVLLLAVIALVIIFIIHFFKIFNFQFGLGGDDSIGIGSENNVSKSSEDIIEIRIDEKNKYYYNKKEYSYDDLDALLDTKDKSSTIIINSDYATKNGYSKLESLLKEKEFNNIINKGEYENEQ